MVSNPEQKTEIVFLWQPRIEGDIAHVEEFLDGVHQTTYGPMAASLVEQFILECKQSVTRTFMNLYLGDSDGQNSAQENQS